MPKTKRGKNEAKIPPEPLCCIYCAKVVGGYTNLEDHVVQEHGVSRHELHCENQKCEHLTFDSLRKRRAHYKKVHAL